MTERLAFKVSDPDEGHDCVVFARDENEALRRGADELHGAEWEGLTAKRAPEFDGLTDPRQLSRAMLSSGWWFTCSECERRVSEDGDDDEEEFDDDGEPVPPVVRNHIVRPSGDVYCSRLCCANMLRDRRRFRENEWNAVAEAVAKWPGIEVVSRDGLECSMVPERSKEGAVGGVRFRFPGGQGQVHWTRGDATVMVEQRDVEAWEAFARELKRVGFYELAAKLGEWPTSMLVGGGRTPDAR